MDSPNVTVRTELDPTLEQVLLPLVENRQEVSAQIEVLETEKKRLSDEISDEMLRAGQDKTQVGEYSLTFSAQERRTLDKAALKIALVERGVGTDIIEAAIRAAEKVSSFTKLDVRKKRGR